MLNMGWNTTMQMTNEDSTCVLYNEALPFISMVTWVVSCYFMTKIAHSSKWITLSTTTMCFSTHAESILFILERKSWISYLWECKRFLRILYLYYHHTLKPSLPYTFGWSNVCVGVRLSHLKMQQGCSSTFRNDYVFSYPQRVIILQILYRLNMSCIQISQHELIIHSPLAGYNVVVYSIRMVPRMDLILYTIHKSLGWLY